MSTVCFGIIEFNMDLDDMNMAYPLTRELVAKSLFHNYYLELTNRVLDPMSRDILDKLQTSNMLEAKNIMEFYLTDAPIAPDFGSGLQEFLILQEQLGEIPYNSNFCKFFKELWTNQMIQKIVIILGWNLSIYEQLELHQVKDINEMFQYVVTDYLKTQGELNSVFVISKEVN